MHTICIDGQSNGNFYYGLSHALPVARRMATMRKRKGDTARITVLDTRTGEHTEVTAR